MVSPILFQATSKNVRMTYTNSFFATPIIISGTGISDMLALDDIPDGAVMEIGTDGTPSVHIKPVLITGRLILQPGSAALPSIVNLVAQQQLIGAGYPGILNITSDTSLWNITYTNFIITSQFTGFQLAEKQKDVTISFKSVLPTATLLGNVVSIAEALAGLGGLV